jgi:hypothetical protein
VRGQGKSSRLNGERGIIDTNLGCIDSEFFFLLSASSYCIVSDTTELRNRDQGQRDGHAAPTSYPINKYTARDDIIR